MGAEHSRRAQSRRRHQPTTVPPLPIIPGKLQLIISENILKKLKLISYLFHALLTHGEDLGFCMLYYHFSSLFFC
jgi:hypothetical protein